MRRFCWRERSEKLNWRLLGALDVSDVVRRGNPAVLEPYALHIAFARLPNTLKDPTTRDAWFLVRVLQLAMEYLLYMRARDGDVLESLSQELRQVEQERDELVVSTQKWKSKARVGDKQVEKLHQVLQNIAKLLQIHGASPSAVATIETLLTELISERRAKQKRRALVENNDEDLENASPAVQEARVCGFCGKIFSSTVYLEKHLVRRHRNERIEVETPVKHKASPHFDVEEKKKTVKNDDTHPSLEAAMQKMVQQMEKALHEHEEKLRLLAQEETQKVKQMYENLHAETKVAEEKRLSRLQTEQLQESQRQLHEVCLQKQKAEDELADLQQQTEFLTAKKQMMGASTKAVMLTNLPRSNDDTLLAAEMEIRELQQTLEAVNAELAVAREELAQVQALNLSALRKKKELADKLALTREPSPVVQQDNSSQTEQPGTVNEIVQTDEPSSHLSVENVELTESSAPVGVDMGTDPLVVSYEEVGSQTLELLHESKLFVDAEAQVSIMEDLAVEHEPVSSSVVPELISDESPSPDASVADEKVELLESATQNADDRVPDDIQQSNIQALLKTIDERAQSAALYAASSNAPVLRNYSSISRHKYVRSRFQHDEDAVKERVASCLEQLEQFSRRFGAPPKSIRLSEDNLPIIQQALHGHLEGLPTDVLSKMVECEQVVNVMIEKEWVPMEKTRQKALERFKAENQSQRWSDFGAVAIDPASRSDHVHSMAMSSNMSFDTSIVTLDESESAEVSTRLAELIDAAAKENDDAVHFLSHEPTTRDVRNDSVVSFDDSDIEEVVLT
ncbi:hypothetical protein PInf_003746 [Phytophthora infestans]|nr:hypothetical protein PInf_003746 [Phytophthora infestans]